MDDYNMDRFIIDEKAYNIIYNEYEKIRQQGGGIIEFINPIPNLILIFGSNKKPDMKVKIQSEDDNSLLYSILPLSEDDNTVEFRIETRKDFYLSDKWKSLPDSFKEIDNVYSTLMYIINTYRTPVIIKDTESTTRLVRSKLRKTKFSQTVKAYESYCYLLRKKVIRRYRKDKNAPKQYKSPCEYSYMVRGHYRHYKSGKVIWIEPYIVNEGKPFRAKTYKL